MKVSKVQFAKAVRFKKKSETYVAEPDFSIDFDPKTGLFTMVRKGEEDLIVLTSVANCAWMHCETKPKTKKGDPGISKSEKE